MTAWPAATVWPVRGADKIALTKLDVLSSMKEIPVITGYTLDGKPVTAFDPTDDLDRMEPVVTMLPGWNCDISHCTLYNELPDEAKSYIEFLEKQLVHVIQFVSTGAEREQYLLKRAPGSEIFPYSSVRRLVIFPRLRLSPPARVCGWGLSVFRLLRALSQSVRERLCGAFYCG